MRTLKKIDLVVQLLLIIGFAITTLVKSSNAFLLGYFVVGGWQGIGMILHRIKKWHTANGSVRNIYHTVTVIVLILAAVSFTLPIMYYYFFLLLFLAPVMALSYFAICFKETFYYTKRPLQLI